MWPLSANCPLTFSSLHASSSGLRCCSWWHWSKCWWRTYVAIVQNPPPHILPYALIVIRAAVLVLVALERVLVGSLLATEAILASLLIRGSIFVSCAGLRGCGAGQG